MFYGIGKLLKSSSSLRTIRSYFKPSQQKEVFYDVEGVVTKDVLLFRYDDTGKVNYIYNCPVFVHLILIYINFQQ